MKKRVSCLSLILIGGSVLQAQIPDSVVVEGVPPAPKDLQADVGRYLEFRSAVFNSWHPVRRELLITTRFADSSQLHVVKMPGGARSQLTFLPEPVAGGKFQPKHGKSIVFSQDRGGGEFYQLYRYDLADGRITLLTDGKSRNTGPRWARSGTWLAYTSTRRTGKDNDLYVVNPAQPGTDRLIIELPGGGWSVTDWSPDEKQLLMIEYISINESHVWLVDIENATKKRVSPEQTDKVSYSQAAFGKDGRSVFLTTDLDFEFQRLARLDLSTGNITFLPTRLQWDVNEFELSPDGSLIAFITNEDGVGVLHIAETKKFSERKLPNLPLGLISNLEWHENGKELAFNLNSAKSPLDVYSIDVEKTRLHRWTESETGGLDASGFVEPQLVRLKSFDETPISAFVYKPDKARHQGRRPVIVNIHGGPESQARPIFQARNNYFLDEMGIAIVYPNVRGSAGYGKTFLTLDNGFRRENSVRDIGAIIEWIQQQPDFDSERIAVAGGSYGGYMVLASMIHFADQLRCGVDVVGISSFLTFLKNTQDYRRDLRRVEYGDERDEKMRKFLEKISPLTQAQRITKPLLVVQGKNDPRVPLSEAEQMVQAIRGGGGKVWYLMAKDEGHGFAKKRNADYQFLATVLFFREHLLN
jgi:dipeptidyl aminopeptidase/acylaminoacyl peptidase